MIVVPWKFDLLKTSIFALARAYICLKNIKFPRGDYQPTERLLFKINRSYDQVSTGYYDIPALFPGFSLDRGNKVEDSFYSLDDTLLDRLQ